VAERGEERHGQDGSEHDGRGVEQAAHDLISVLGYGANKETLKAQSVGINYDRCAAISTGVWPARDNSPPYRTR